MCKLLFTPVCVCVGGGVGGGGVCVYKGVHLDQGLKFSNSRISKGGGDFFDHFVVINPKFDIL